MEALKRHGNLEIWISCMRNLSCCHICSFLKEHRLHANWVINGDRARSANGQAQRHSSHSFLQVDTPFEHTNRRPASPLYVRYPTCFPPALSCEIQGHLSISLRTLWRLASGRRVSSPRDFASLPDPDDIKTYVLEICETSTVVKAIAFTRFEPRCTTAEFLWPGSGEVTVLAYLRDASLLACQIRDEQVISESGLLEWLKGYGPTFMDAFASCSLSDHRHPTPVEVALEIEATIRYYLAAKGVVEALECDGQMFKWNFARACQRLHQKLLQENKIKGCGSDVDVRGLKVTPALSETPEESSGSTEQCISRPPRFLETSQSWSDAHGRSGAEGNIPDREATSHTPDENERRSAINNNFDMAALERQVKKLRIEARKTRSIADKVATLEVRLSASEDREKTLKDQLDATAGQQQALLIELSSTKTDMVALQNLEAERKDVVIALRKENDDLKNAMSKFGLQWRRDTVLARSNDEWNRNHIKDLEDRVEQVEAYSRTQATSAKLKVFYAPRVATPLEDVQHP